MSDGDSTAGVDGRIPADTDKLSIGDVDRDTNEIVLGSVRIPFTNDRQAATVQYDDLCTGMCITGTTGTGKTTVATNILTQLAVDGQGFVYMDAKGSGTIDLLQSLPESRLDDVRIVGTHPNEYDTIRGFNLRETPKSEHISPLLVEGLFNKISGTDLDVDVVNSLHAAFVVADRLDMDIAELQDVFDMDSDELAEHGIEPDEYIHQNVGFQSLTDEIESAFGGNELSNNPVLNEVFDRDGHSIYNAIINGEIIILCVDSWVREIQQIVGAALFGKLTEALIEGGLNPDEFYPVVVDNFDVFELPTTVVEKYASESRSYQSPLITLIQSPDRFPPTLRNKLYTNIGNWICFKIMHQQAENELKPYINFDHHSSLSDLDLYESVVRLTEEYGTYTGLMRTFDKPTPKRSANDTEML